MKIIFHVICAIFLFTSCIGKLSLQKRRYTKGFYIEFSKSIEPSQFSNFKKSCKKVKSEIPYLTENNISEQKSGEEDSTFSGNKVLSIKHTLIKSSFKSLRGNKQEVEKKCKIQNNIKNGKESITLKKPFQRENFGKMLRYVFGISLICVLIMYAGLLFFPTLFAEIILLIILILIIACLVWILCFN